MARPTPNPVALPCGCGSVVLVTGRRSKALERPRIHKCKKCGAEYRIDAGTLKVRDVVTGMPIPLVTQRA